VVVIEVDTDFYFVKVFSFSLSSWFLALTTSHKNILVDQESRAVSLEGMRSRGSYETSCRIGSDIILLLGTAFLRAWCFELRLKTSRGRQLKFALCKKDYRKATEVRGCRVGG
jgi:hypothetical protein